MEFTAVSQQNGSMRDDQMVTVSQGVTFGGVTEISLQTQIANRVKRKAKRRQLDPTMKAPHSPVKLQQSGAPQSPGKLKKDRHSRTGRRGVAKKGGAGGKGTWGKLVEVYNDEPAQDNRDPNYDSEEDDYVVTPSVPEMKADEFQRYGGEVIKEYLEHGDVDEVLSALAEYNLNSIKHEIPRLAVTLAMERKPAYRELISVLLSDIYGNLIDIEDMMQGFDILLDEIEELKLDTPDAEEALGNFIARAVADDCLPPAYITKNGISSSSAKLALQRAKLLLSMKHGLARLDNVWGVGGGQRPVVYLVNKMNLLIKEYLSSGDIAEACRCLQELDVPHFHHELVYEAVLVMMEEFSDYNVELLCKLLQHMEKATIVTEDQMQAGFMRIYNDMTEISLDIPNGYLFLTKFVEHATMYNFLPQVVIDELPQRGRKRFVSEGDGGAVKDPEY